MKRLVLVKRERKGGLLKAGQHAVVISEASVVESKAIAEWKDRSTQIKAEFKNDSGIICRWYNTKGYKSIADFPTGVAPKGYEFRSSSNEAGESNNENYLVNTKTNLRVENTEKSDVCVDMLGELMVDAGLDLGADYSVSDKDDSIDYSAVCADLFEKEIGILVKEDGKKFVSRTMPVDAVEVEEDEEA